MTRALQVFWNYKTAFVRKITIFSFSVDFDLIYIIKLGVMWPATRPHKSIHLTLNVRADEANFTLNVWSFGCQPLPVILAVQN